MAYSTLVIRGAILLCLTFALINAVVLSTFRALRFNLYSTSNGYYPSSADISISKEFYYICIPLTIIFVIATLTSVGLIFGINRRKASLVIPYLIFDTILTLFVSLLWIASMFLPIIFALTTIICGEFWIFFSMLHFWFYKFLIQRIPMVLVFISLCNLS